MDGPYPRRRRHSIHRASRRRRGQPIANVTVTSAASSCEPGATANDCVGGRLRGGHLAEHDRVRDAALDDPHDVADLDAGGLGVLLGADRGVGDGAGAGLGEHGLRIVVGERDPAQRQLVADDALQRVDHAADLRRRRGSSPSRSSTPGTR